MPDTKALWLLREQLARHGLIDRLFHRFYEQLWQSGLIPKGGQIIDSHYGYKNHINVDKEHKLIHRYAVTEASAHDSRLFDDLLAHQQFLFMGASAIDYLKVACSLPSYSTFFVRISMSDETTRRCALPKGTKIREFRIEAVLGAGSFGIVYLARHESLDESFAIKEFLPEEIAKRVEKTRVVPISDESSDTYAWAVGKFLEEAKILRALNRPVPNRSIVSVVNVMEANGTAYMVMEYEQGEPLSSILKNKGALSQAEVTAILAPLLDGLEKTHATEVLHRDIKPENILIRPDGSPVLIDFGAARQRFTDPAKSEMAVFSRAYAAPEQIFLEDPQGPWTDIFGLGTTLYEALTGERPPNAWHRWRERNEASAAVTGKENDGSEFLSAINAARELQPANRPQSIAEWRRLLRFELSDEQSYRLPPLSDDRTIVIAPRKSQPRFDRRYLAGLVFLLLASAVSVWLWWPVEQPIHDDPQLHDDPQREVRALLHDFECARLVFELSPAGRFSVSGHVASKEDRARLDKQLASIVQAQEFDTHQVTVNPWPFCKVLEVLNGHTQSASDLSTPLVLETNNPSGVYADGDELTIYITTHGGFDGYLYVTHIDNNGDITHLLPAPEKPNNIVSAAQSIALGEQSTESYAYRVAEPFGKAMLLAVQSQNPLFDNSRPEVESAVDYLSALTSALDRIASQPMPSKTATAHLYFRVNP